ncbi:MAG: diaminopimelate decarboxylase [Herpetosiphon sp.]
MCSRAAVDELADGLWPDAATIAADGELRLGGSGVRALVQRWGTPLYVLEPQTVRRTARAYSEGLQAAYGGPTAVHYASKALFNTAVAQLMSGLGLGLDCVSMGEAGVALRAGVQPEKIHLHGNAKSSQELEQAVALGLGRIVVDSLDEVHALAAITAECTKPIPIWLRVNPGIEVHTHAHIQTAQLDSKFGLALATGMAEQAFALLADAPGLQLRGLHAHLGSQITELEPLRRAVQLLVEVAADVRQRYGWQVDEISPGGGLAVAYQDGDEQPGIEQYVQAIGRTADVQCRRHGLAPLRVVIEPGRSLIARSVVALYSVVARKEIPGVRRYVAVDGGMGDNIRPALSGAQYTVRRADRSGSGEPVAFTIAGRFCESGDLLAQDVVLAPLEPGALLAFAQAGAYTLSMASNYNLVTRPALVMVHDGQAWELQRREGIADLVARDQPWPESW